jgi:hypothetical protein
VPEGKSPGDQVHITIADKRLRHQRLCVYTNLFQAHDTSKANGTGLGLWLSRGIT